jgi:hypothetical protein
MLAFTSASSSIIILYFLRTLTTLSYSWVIVMYAALFSFSVTLRIRYYLCRSTPYEELEWICT